MPYPLNNYTTTDNYVTPNGEAVFSPPRQTAAVTVTNAAIYLSLAPAISGHASGATYGQEIFLVPGRYFLDSADFAPATSVALMKVRSAATGVPAQVSIV